MIARARSNSSKNCSAALVLLSAYQSQPGFEFSGSFRMEENPITVHSRVLAINRALNSTQGTVLALPESSSFVRLTISSSHSSSA